MCQVQSKPPWQQQASDQAANRNALCEFFTSQGNAPASIHKFLGQKITGVEAEEGINARQKLRGVGKRNGRLGSCGAGDVQGEELLHAYFQKLSRKTPWQSQGGCSAVWHMLKFNFSLWVFFYLKKSQKLSFKTGCLLVKNEFQLNISQLNIIFFLLKLTEGNTVKGNIVWHVRWEGKLDELMIPSSLKSMNLLPA